MNKEEYDRMPLANRKVYDLIADKAGGVKSRFATLIYQKGLHRHQ